EQDYLSAGGTLGYTFDFNRRLTTLAVKGGLTLDQVQPVGGAPTGLQSLSSNQTQTATTSSGSTSTSSGDGTQGEGGEGLEGKSKVVTDLMVGVTQVLTRRTLVQLNYTHTFMNGYLTDPYKVLSVVSASTGETQDYVHEKRPSTRNTDALYLKLVQHLGFGVAHLSYRYFRDDWGIRSHTGELKYHLKLGGSFYLEPQARYYTQTAAKFYHYSLVSGEPAKLDYASADLRLGRMTSTTFGLKVGGELFGGDLSLRYARMRQTGNSHPDSAIGVQRQYNLYPTLDATIVNLSYSTKF
ncbi:MAG TPA: DUF3570 domain-containing protein, partial [Gammaproteobacteria bacterium]|nr:DUF3570 domain-containing protein [Gammaproteobacteria bacterium]